MRLWNTRTGELVRVVEAQPTGVRCVTLNANATTLLSGGVDGSIQIWDVATGNLRATLRGHPSEVWEVALEAADRLAISCGLDGTVRLWDIASGDGTLLRIMRPDRPYERMDITALTGISDVQRKALMALGAVAA